MALVLTTWIGLHFLFGEVYKTVSSSKAALGNSHDGYARKLAQAGGARAGDSKEETPWGFGSKNTEQQVGGDAGPEAGKQIGKRGKS